MNRFMVIIMKTGFAVLFLAVFAVILALGCAAAEMLRPSATAQKYSSWRMVMEMRLLTSYTKKV